MKLDSPLQEGIFLERPNRFAAWVEVNGSPAMVHVPNSGRMRELFQRGNRLLLTPRAKPGRKTDFDMSLVDLGHTLVSSDARLPPALVYEAFVKRQLGQFSQYTWARREVTFSHSRLDMVMSNGGLCYVEMKSVTLVENGVGLFPDAPTSRGVRHLHALARAKARDTGPPSYLWCSVRMSRPSDPTTRRTPSSVVRYVRFKLPGWRSMRIAAACRRKR